MVKYLLLNPLKNHILLAFFQVFEMKEVVECLCHGLKNQGPYPPSVRAFCMSLHYTSPRAYEYLRQKFAKHLPHAQTIRQWYRNSNLDASSGIGMQSLDALEAKAKSMDKQLIINLNFDEMNIQRNLTWCRATNKFIGLIDEGKPNEDEEFTLAKDVIVFMAVGINAYFQQPIAYYFIQSLTGKEKAEILCRVMDEVIKRGIKIVDVSCDGHRSNAAMFKHLGTKLQLENGDFKHYFVNPIDSEKINIILDPSHAIKLIRNTIGNIKIIYEGKNEIKWQYFIELVNYSSNNTFGLTHKMTKRHIQYEDRKMHVRTAVQTLSNSTANSMEFLKSKGVVEFSEAAATIKFIKFFDKIWDIFNSQRIRSDQSNIFKSALNKNNASAIFEFLNDAKKYILSLKVVNRRTGLLVSIVESDYNTGFRGFILNINSAEAMFKQFVENQHLMDFLATYRLSQDHLEQFFGAYNL